MTLFHRVREEEVTKAIVGSFLRQFEEYVCSDAIIVGAGDRIELWNPDSWNAAKLEAEEQMPQIMENLKVQQ